MKVGFLISCISFSVKLPNSCMTLKSFSVESAIITISLIRFLILFDIEIYFCIFVFYPHQFFLILLHQGSKIFLHTFLLFTVIESKISLPSTPIDFLNKASFIAMVSILTEVISLSVRKFLNNGSTFMLSVTQLGNKSDCSYHKYFFYCTQYFILISYSPSFRAF